MRPFYRFIDMCLVLVGLVATLDAWIRIQPEWTDAAPWCLVLQTPDPRLVPDETATIHLERSTRSEG